jgi:hypothetical protein
VCHKVRSNIRYACSGYFAGARNPGRRERHSIEITATAGHVVRERSDLWPTWGPDFAGRGRAFSISRMPLILGKALMMAIHIGGAQ